MEEFADRAELALREAAFDVRLPFFGWVPVAIGERAIFWHEERGLVAKVGRSSANFADAHREVSVAKWLMASGVLAEEALDVLQPTFAARLPVTFWRAAEGSGTTPERLAGVLKALHGVQVPAELELPRIEPFRRMRQWLGMADGVSRGVLLFLAALIDEREARLGEAFAAAEVVPLHGDADVDNIRVDERGRPRLFDLDGICLGPWQWDAVITAVHHELGWHTEPDYQRYCEVYGADVRRDEAYPVLKGVQELRMVCRLARRAAESARVGAEFAMRVRDLGKPETPRRWCPC